MRCSKSLDCSRSQIRILHVAEFLLILFSLFHLIELFFGRVLASVCEAQLRLCGNFDNHQSYSKLEGLALTIQLERSNKLRILIPVSLNFKLENHLFIAGFSLRIASVLMRGNMGVLLCFVEKLIFEQCKALWRIWQSAFSTWSVGGALSAWVRSSFSLQSRIFKIFAAH